MGQTKSQQVKFRVVPAHKRLLDRAAAARGETLTDLLTRASLQEATAVLASREDSEQGADHASA